MTRVMSSAHAKALGAKSLCSSAPLAASGEPPWALRPPVPQPSPPAPLCPPGAQSRALPSWLGPSVAFLKASLSPTGSKPDQPSLPSFPLNKAGSAERPPSTSLSPGGAEGSKPVPVTRLLSLWMASEAAGDEPRQGDVRLLLVGRRYRSWLLPGFY